MSERAPAAAAEDAAAGADVDILGVIAAYALPVGTGGLLLLALLFGGGTQQGIPSDAVVELASLPVLAIAIARLYTDGLAPAARWPVIMAAVILVFPLLQLVPLPPALWTHLPLRHAVADIYRSAGMALPVMPLSLNPAGTWRGFLSLLPAMAIFLGTLSLGGHARRVLIALVIGVGIVSVGLDLLQSIGGPNSPLRFYAVTNVDRAVGFFANSNHDAAALYCLVPFAAALTVDAINFRGWHSRAAFGLFLMVLIVVAVGLVLTVSRAGLLLWVMAGGSAVWLGWKQARRVFPARMRGVVIGAGVAVLLAMLLFGFTGLVGRINDNATGQYRWELAGVTLSQAGRALPWGTGLGSFVPVFRMAAPRTLMGERYVNHAHNDWAELTLETGLPGILLMAAFLAWLAVLARRQRGPGAASRDQPFAFAGLTVLLLLLLHSAVDYPLRTLALMSYFALSCALLVPRASVGEADGGHRPQSPHADPASRDA